ncbi:MAG: SMP-30/gluconolactonase/LRE family protein [Pseudolabrys sp.]
MEYAAESLGSVRCTFGESPVWDAAAGRLYCCDVHAGAVHAVHPVDGGHRTWHFDTCVGSLGLAAGGRLVVALRRRVVLFDPVTGDIELVAAFDFESPHLRLNDGKVGPDGAFWVGSVHEVDLDKMQPIGALYRVGADGSTTTQVSGLKASNGLAWSADGTEMFHSDSCGPWIDRWRFAPETGEISGRQRLARPGEQEGRPDGGATDMLGTYWSAGTSAGVLNRYERSGRLLEKIRLPVPRPTMPCFGGADMKTLFVTSRCDVLTAEQRVDAPLSGAVLRLRCDVAGVPGFVFGQSRL